MRYEYRVIPLAAGLDSSTRRRIANRSASAAAEHLQSLIDKYSVDGWEFWSVEHKSVREAATLVAWFLGFPSSSSWLDLVVFRREERQDG